MGNVEDISSIIKPRLSGGPSLLAYSKLWNLVVDSFGTLFNKYHILRKYFKHGRFYPFW